MVACLSCLLNISGREGCLAILLDKSVKHYDLAQHQLIIDLDDRTVWADVPYLGVIACIHRGKKILTGAHK